MVIPFKPMIQLVNCTAGTISFSVESLTGDKHHCPLPDLPPRETRLIKQGEVFGLQKDNRRIFILINGKPTHHELKPSDVLEHLLIKFKFENSSGSGDLAPKVEGVKETEWIDLFLSLKYIGFLRDRCWSDRDTDRIETTQREPKASKPPGDK